MHENELILALDLGKKTGWAIKSVDGTVRSGTHVIKTMKIDMGGRKFFEFRRFLSFLYDKYGHFSDVYFEDVKAHSGTCAAHAYGGYLAILQVFCETNLITYNGVSVGSIKKHAAGRGNAFKEEVIDSIRKKGYNPVDDNEADALALLHFVIDDGANK